MPTIDLGSGSFNLLDWCVESFLKKRETTKKHTFQRKNGHTFSDRIQHYYYAILPPPFRLLLPQLSLTETSSTLPEYCSTSFLWRMHHFQY